MCRCNSNGWNYICECPCDKCGDPECNGDCRHQCRDCSALIPVADELCEDCAMVEDAMWGRR